MAYSDYGAYVWKNGELMHGDQYLDTAFIYLEDKGWTCTHSLSDEEYENFIIPDEQTHLAKNVCEGHAFIKLTKDLCLGCYKTYGIKVFNKLKAKEYSCTKIRDTYQIKYNRDLIITGFPLDNAECIWQYEIEYENDTYLIIIGPSFGNGFDKKHISKLILKMVYFDSENKFYYLKYKNKNYYPTEEMIEKAIRLDQIDFEKYCINKFVVKPLLRDLIRFNFKGVLFHLGEYREKRLIVKYLK